MIGSRPTRAEAQSGCAIASRSVGPFGAWEDGAADLVLRRNRRRRADMTRLDGCQDADRPHTRTACDCAGPAITEALIGQITLIRGVVRTPEPVNRRLRRRRRRRSRPRFWGLAHTLARSRSSYPEIAICWIPPVSVTHPPSMPCLAENVPLVESAPMYSPPIAICWIPPVSVTHPPPMPCLT